MANQWIRCNLGASIFPFATELMGRTVIVPQYDETWDNTNLINTVKDKGVPQVYYMHNVMPTVGGFQSIGYSVVAEPISPAASDFDRVIPIQNADTLDRFLFSPAGGKNYIYDNNQGGWFSCSPLSDAAGLLVTVAQVEAQSYIYYEGVGCFKYNESAATLDAVTLTGLDATQVLGICAANGYLIAFTKNGVAWSSLTDPTDFVPSIITGAGGGSVQDAKGKIKFCLPISGGFVIYCEQNAVGATFTGNNTFPYQYLEIPASSGIASPDDVSWLANLDSHFAYTTAGIWQLTATKSQSVYPEASEFLADKIFEDFDEGTLVFFSEYLTDALNVQVSIVSKRYTIFSYGVTAPDFTHALIYDSVLGRWGKLKVNHRAAFEWNAPTTFTSLTYDELAPKTYNQLLNSDGSFTTYDEFTTGDNALAGVKQQLAFLQADGTVQLVVFDISEVTADGVFLIGKYQERRNYFLTHQATDVETVSDGNTFTCYVIPTLDGKTFLTPVVMFEQVVAPKMRKYLKRISGQNFSILFIGAFNLTSVLMNYTVGGQR